MSPSPTRPVRVPRLAELCDTNPILLLYKSDFQVLGGRGDAAAHYYAAGGPHQARVGQGRGRRQEDQGGQ
jgi:hypothetical protein